MFKIILALAFSLLLAACGGDDDCPAGQGNLYNSGYGYSACRPLCTRDSQCASNEACACYNEGGGGVCASLTFGRGRTRNPDRVCPGGTTPTMPPSGGCATCASGQLCVNNNGTPTCARTCSSDSQCGGTCCASLTNGARVCAPSTSLCSGTTPPPSTPPAATCTDRTSCVSGRTTRPGSSLRVCGADYVGGFLRNGCSERVQCAFRFIGGGGDTGGPLTINPGQEVGGEYGGIWTCSPTAGVSIQYRCATVASPASCVALR